MLKNVGKTIDADRGKPIKSQRGGARSRGGGKFQKRAGGSITVSNSRHNFRDNGTMSQVFEQQAHKTGRRTVRKKRIKNNPEEEEPASNFNDEEWIHEPVDKIETGNPNLHVSEEEDDDASEFGDVDGNEVGFETENGESSGYGIANNEIRWGETEVSNEEGYEDVEEEDDDDEIMKDDYGNDGRNFEVEDSDSFGSGEYSD